MLNTPVMFFFAGMGGRSKKPDTRTSGLAFMQTKGAMRLMRAYSEISSRTTKYALVVLAESCGTRRRGRGSCD